MIEERHFWELIPFCGAKIQNLHDLHKFFLFLMKNTSSIIKDLLAIIERQERELKSTAKRLSMNQLENEQLKSSLKESQRSIHLLSKLAEETIKNGAKISGIINGKQGNGGNNSFFSGNN
jgi:septation ring formation regulator EzrA